MPQNFFLCPSGPRAGLSIYLGSPEARKLYKQAVINMLLGLCICKPNSKIAWLELADSGLLAPACVPIEGYATAYGAGVYSVQVQSHVI